MSNQWFLRVDETVYGPLSSEMLRAYAVEGRISESSEVSKEQSGPWHPASRVKGLFRSKTNLTRQAVELSKRVEKTQQDNASMSTPPDRLQPDGPGLDEEFSIWTGSACQSANIPIYVTCGFGFCLIGGLWLIYVFGSVRPSFEIAVVFCFTIFVPLLVAIWHWLYLRSTIYEVTNERIRINSGILTRSIEEVELYRIKDTSFTQDIFQKPMGLATIHFATSDSSSPKVEIQSIPVDFAKELRENIRAHVERLRESKRVREVDHYGR